MTYAKWAKHGTTEAGEKAARLGTPPASVDEAYRLRKAAVGTWEAQGEQQHLAYADPRRHNTSTVYYFWDSYLDEMDELVEDD